MMNTQSILSKSENKVGGGKKYSLFVIFLCLPTFFYTIFYDYLRTEGALLFIIVSIFALYACVLTNQVIFLQRYIPFLLFCTLILTLSVFQIMPKSWTTYHNTYAAFRQFSPFFLLPLISTAFYILLNEYSAFIQKNSLFLLIISYLITRIIYFFGSNKITDSEPFWTIYGITNSTAPIFIFLILYLFKEKKLLFFRIFLLTVFCLISSSMTSLLLSFTICLIFFLNLNKFIVNGLLAFTAIFLMIAPFYILPLTRIDPNTGIRALFWHDTLLAMKDSDGLGVGYGTEYIKNNFLDMGKSDDWVLVDESSNERLYVGTHSTIYDIMLRTGIVGVLLFLYWMISIINNNFRIIKSYSLKFMITANRPFFEKSNACFAACFILNNSVNIGIASIHLFFSSALFLAAMRMIRDFTKIQESS